MRTMHLFAGAGGGLLGDLILGHKPLVAVEWDKWRAYLLSLRAAQGWFPDLKVENCDVRTFDGRGWARKVDVLHAGIPCPRWSKARRGVGDPEDYWPEVARIANEVSPRFIFIESVEGIKEEHDRFETDLARIGYTLKPAIITDAASVGAPHSRRRYWALAYSNKDRESMCAVNAETSLLPPPDDCGWWETNPHSLRVDDGVADRVDRRGLEAVGDGQVPLQMALAWCVLSKGL